MATGFEKLGIGPDLPPKLILDFCWNHEGSIARIRQMLQALKDNLTPEQYALVIPKFQAGRDLPWDRPYYRGIKKMCEEEFGLPFLCTAFDYKAVDMLDSMDVAAIKIGSAEAVDRDFINYAYRTKRSLIVSNGGLADRQHMALSVMPNIKIMHCVSLYPATPESLCLNAIGPLIDGYSSHYPGIEDAIFAMALGAQMIEKHYALYGIGPDAAVSISWTQAKHICDHILLWQKMRGTTKSQEVLDAERALLKPFRERFYAGIKDHHQTDHHPRQDQVPGSDAGRNDSERT